MYMLHLFDADHAEPIEARLHAGGRLRIGRDRAADWSIVDPDHAISRAHLELNAGAGGLELTAVGANGVYDGSTGERFPDRVAVSVALPCSFRLGRFRIAATHAGAGSPVNERRRFVDGTLLEAFCEGAGLDVSQLSDDDPVAIMRRAGAVYREMVGGLSELVAARDQARARYQLNRTTIAGVGNNPFKWGPAQRLAVDLLADRGEGFLTGPVALRASFADVRRHLHAAAAGYRAAIGWVVARVAPAALDEAVAGQVSIIRHRTALAAAELASRHAAMADELAGEPGGPIDRAFVAGYESADR